MAGVEGEAREEGMSDILLLGMLASFSTRRHDGHESVTGVHHLSVCFAGKETSTFTHR